MLLLMLLAGVTFAGDSRAESSVRVCIASSTRAQTLRQAGQLLAAREQLIACARDACPAIVRAQCAKWLGELETRIPSVVVRAQTATGDDVIEGAEIRIDGVVHPLDGHAVRLDPGEHVFVLQTTSGARQQDKVLLVEGEPSRIVTLRLPAAAPPPAAPEAPARSAPDARRVPLGAWITGGAGLLALGSATYFGFAARSQLDGLQNTCSPHCSEGQTQAGRNDALAFDVLLGVGGAAVGAALVWALVFPSVDGAPATSLVPFDVQPVGRGAVATWTLHYGR